MKFKQENVRFMWGEDKSDFIGYCADNVHELRRMAEDNVATVVVSASNNISFPFDTAATSYRFAYFVREINEVRVGSVWQHITSGKIAMVVVKYPEAVVLGNEEWDIKEVRKYWKEVTEDGVGVE